MSNRVSLRLLRSHPLAPALAFFAAAALALTTVGPHFAAADDGDAKAQPKPAAAGTGGASGGSAAAGKPQASQGSDKEVTDDLEMLQGNWERDMRPEEKVPYTRTLKQISGNREFVTYYKEDGSVYHAHEVEFRLERHGQVKVFTFFNMEVTEGKDKGKRTPEERSYIYRVTPKEFCEVWGFLPGQETRQVTYHCHHKVEDPAKTLAKDGTRKPDAGRDRTGPGDDAGGAAVPAAGRVGPAGDKSQPNPENRAGTTEKPQPK